MAQARRKIAHERSRFEEAVAFLSHVEVHPRVGRDFWVIGETAGIVNERTKTQRVLVNYELDCDLGRTLGATFVAVLSRYPDEAADLISYTLKSMLKHGRFSGVEIAFIDALARSVKVSGRPIAVVAAEQRVAAMHEALNS